MFVFNFRRGQRVLDRPCVCDLSIPETALSTLINSVVLRHHAEGLPVLRRNTTQASRRTRRMTRMELSYAQNLEDYHLSLAFAGQITGTFIDIGAGHPVADNVSFWFYERGWRGIAVEPQRDLVALYARLRPRDIAVQCLVGRQCGEMDFHVVDRLHGLSTTVDSLARRATQFGVDYRTVRMPVVTL